MRAGIGGAALPVTAYCAMCCETRKALFSNSALLDALAAAGMRALHQRAP